MAELYRVLTPPGPPAGALTVENLRYLVAVDVVLRAARARGETTEWVAAALVGDIIGQRAVERELAREGADRESLGRDAFVERARTADEQARSAITTALDALAITPPNVAGTTADDAAVVAARVAFVRLYEEGLLERAERVVGECPRCRTVVAAADRESADMEGERLVVRATFTDGDGSLEVPIDAPELLPGVVAVTVPEGHEASGHSVELPLTTGPVPVVSVADLDRADEPVVAAPAHDPAAHEVTRKLGIAPVEVLGPDGVVSAPGELEGLGHFAARSAAQERLAAEGVVVDAEPTVEQTERCRWCGTVLVLRLGTHWFLEMAGLEAAVADWAREGAITFSSPEVRETLLEHAGRSEQWCVSHQLWAGQSVPIARCLDCGKTTVAVDVGERSTCGSCMGGLDPDPDVLDARFIGAVWPLVAAGWPQRSSHVADLATCTTLLVDAAGSDWLLPIAALGLRLAGAAPFSRVMATRGNEERPSVAEATDEGFDTLVLECDTRLARAALLLGGGADPPDVDRARILVDTIDNSRPGTTDVDRASQDIDALLTVVGGAIEVGDARAALASIGAAAERGPSSDNASRLHELARLLLGD